MDLAIFTSPCTLSALIGSFLFFAASFFKKLDIPLRESKFLLKVLFILCGYLIGLVLHMSENEFNPLTCMAIGGGWIYVALGFKSTAKAFASAKVLKNMKKVVVKHNL